MDSLLQPCMSILAYVRILFLLACIRTQGDAPQVSVCMNKHTGDRTYMALWTSTR
jgi:hypothetical protein